MVPVCHLPARRGTTGAALREGWEVPLTKQELIEAADKLTGGDVATLSIEQLCRLMTVAQHVTDLCLNEVERRGELTFDDGFPVVPYECDYMVETILTREERPHGRLVN